MMRVWCNRVDGHPRSLISVQIESAHATSYYRTAAMFVLYILHRFRDIAGSLLKTRTLPLIPRIVIGWDSIPKSEE